MNDDIIDKLYTKYLKHYGESPEFEFWSWLSAMGIHYSIKSLENLYNDKDYW